MTDRLILQFSSAADSPANWQTAAIRRLAHSEFSHVEFLLPNSERWPEGAILCASDQGARSPCIEGNPRGVAIRPSDYQAFAIRRRMILETDAASAVLEAALSQLDKPFDPSGLWGFLSDPLVDAIKHGKRDWRDPDKWWCSEHATWSLERGLYFRFPLTIEKDRVTPADLRLILLQDDRWINRDTFDQPIAGLKLGKYER